MGRDKWAVLDEAKSALLWDFAAKGVGRVEYVVGFVEPYAVSVWLGTATDAQRDALADYQGLPERVGDVLKQAGIEESDAVFSGSVVAQSQETVDREFEGSWFYALR